MKILTISVIANVAWKSNLYKTFSGILAIFGLVMMFAVSGWGACGTFKSTWNTPASGSGSSTNYSSDYYQINVNSVGDVQLQINNTSNALFDSSQDVIAAIYSDNQCTTTAIWSATIQKRNSATAPFPSAAVGTYYLKLTEAQTTAAKYSWSGTYTAPPSVSAQTFNVSENSAGGTTVGTVSATNSPTSFSIIGGTGQSFFNISNAGVITVKSGAVLDYESATSYTLTVQATSSVGSGTGTITVNLTNILGPTITSGQSFSVVSGTSNGTTVGTVTTTGITPTTFTISGTPFAISSTGVITVANSSALTVGSASYTVTATNGEGSDSKTVTITVNTPSADLQLTTTYPATAKTYNTMQYLFSVRNNGPANTNNIVLTDVLPANVTYQTSYGNDWICTYTSVSRTVSCIHPTELPSGTIADDITLVVIAPGTSQTVTNSATVTSSVFDSNTVNNTNSMSTTISGAVFTSNNERPFTLQKQYNINGNMKVIGNSMLLKSDGSCAGDSTDNNDISTTWANKDTDGTTWNASSADLTLPKGVNSSKIKYAGLYWQGRVDSDNDNATFWANAKTVKFKAPGLAYQTLTSLDSKYNWTLRSSDANYQGALDVTAILKNSIDTVSSATIDSTGFSGTFFGANIQAEKMTNGFGAWSLVVIYEDYADTLKNISLYDGYVSVDNGETIPTTLSGFLTPTSGAVESNFLVFAGEGDVTLTDSVTMSNSSGDQSLGSNVFNSSQTIDGQQVTARDPSCKNTIGIDIDSFDVGTTSVTTPIIRNNQTSTIVKLKSTGDVYYPGVFAFSTQLYVPDVCYLEDVTFNGLPVTASNLPETEDNVEFEVTITNKDNEAAKGVFIEKVFDKPNEITYVSGSMQVAPIPGTTYAAKTDNIGDDTAEYSSDSNTTKYLLGTGAAWYEGGTIVKNAITKFKYQAKIGDQNASENTYLVSYRNDLLHITFSGLPIRKCVDFNNSFGVYVPVIGKFNTVHSGAVNVAGGDTDPLDVMDVKNALYTQIVNRAFNVDVISFGNDNITPANYTGDLNLTIVELPESGVCDETILDLSSSSTLSFAAQKYKSATITPTKASKNAVFKMVTSNASLCSRDRFSIRPSGYSIDANETQLVGNRPYQFTFKAYHDGAPATASLNYHQAVYDSADKNATTQLVIPTGCTLANPVEFTSNALPFSDGQVDATVIYSNIGDVNVSVSDAHWSNVDSSGSKGDCNVGSSSTVADGYGKVGCMVQNSKVFHFFPKQFDATLALANGTGNGFTYISNEQNMSAALTLGLNAKLDGGGTATNYTAKCFARDINATMTLMNNKTLSWQDSQNRITFYDDLNITSGLLTQTNNNAKFLIRDGNFSNGVATSTIRFNFDRNETVLDNAFNIARNDFNTTQIIDQNNTSGSDFNRNNDMNATFVYGRMVPRDIRTFGTVSFSANGWYEVYNTPTLNGVNMPSSRNDAMWYINVFHTDFIDGNATVSQVSAGYLPSNTTYATGVKTYNFNASATVPFSAKAHINTDPWLWYGVNALTYHDPDGTHLDCLTHPCFNINIVPSIGTTGSAKSGIENNKNNKATNKGTTGWHSTTDYAPAIR